MDIETLKARIAIIDDEFRASLGRPYPDSQLESYHEACIRHRDAKLNTLAAEVATLPGGMSCD